VAAIDDAASELLDAFFIWHECLFGYMKLLARMVKRYAIPCSIYQDRDGNLHRNDNNWTPEGTGQRGYAKARVRVRQLVDGTWRVYYKDTLVAQTDPTPLIELISAKPRRKPMIHGASAEQRVIWHQQLSGYIFTKLKHILIWH
jgi:hypothetical protein